VRADGKPIISSFQNVPTVLHFLELEDVGFEHLLHDIKDIDVSAVGTILMKSVHGLAALGHRLHNISEYLGDVIEKKLLVDYEVLGIARSIFDLLPNLATFNSVAIPKYPEDPSFRPYDDRGIWDL
jgi:26S proteasome regulatory subunit N8